MRRCLAFCLVVLAPASALAQPVEKWRGGGCEGGYCDTGWYASPAVVDLDGDGDVEVIWGGYDLVVLDGSSGEEIWRGPNGQRIWPSPAVADLTGDGTLEVVVGRGGDQLTAYGSDGSELWTRHPFGGGEVRTLALGDLDGSGDIEIVVGRASGGDVEQVNVFEPDGSVRPGFPARHAGDPGYGWGMYNQNVTLGNLNQDGQLEIYAPTDTHYITALDPSGEQLPASELYGAGKVWSEVGVHVDQAADLQGYADCGVQHRPNFANSAPVVADVDGNGTDELIVVGDVYDCSIGDPEGDLYHTPFIFNIDRTRWRGSGYDWETVPVPEAGSGPLSEDYDVIQNSVTSAVVADLDNDGEKEILYPSYDGKLHAVWLDKTAHGSWPFVVPGDGINFASEPAVVDIEGDGPAEVIVATWPENGGGRRGRLHILDSSGQELESIDLPEPLSDSWNGSLGAPTVANIDSDPDMEIVIGTTASGVVAYDLPDSADARILWGTSRGGLMRSGKAGDAPPTVDGGTGGTDGTGGTGGGAGGDSTGGDATGGDATEGGGNGGDATNDDDVTADDTTADDDATADDTTADDDVTADDTAADDEAAADDDATADDTTADDDAAADDTTADDDATAADDDATADDTTADDDAAADDTTPDDDATADDTTADDDAAAGDGGGGSSNGDAGASENHAGSAQSLAGSAGVAPTGRSDSGDDGCSCGVAGHSRHAAWLPLLLALPWLRRRRRGEPKTPSASRD